MQIKTIMFCEALCWVVFTSRDYVMFFNQAIYVCAASLQSYILPLSVRRGQHLHPAYPFMCRPRSAACAVCSCERSIQQD